MPWEAAAAATQTDSTPGYKNAGSRPPHCFFGAQTFQVKWCFTCTHICSQIALRGGKLLIVATTSVILWLWENVFIFCCYYCYFVIVWCYMVSFQSGCALEMINTGYDNWIKGSPLFIWTGLMNNAFHFQVSVKCSRAGAISLFTSLSWSFCCLESVKAKTANYFLMHGFCHCRFSFPRWTWG